MKADRAEDVDCNAEQRKEKRDGDWQGISCRSNHGSCLRSGVEGIREGLSIYCHDLWPCLLVWGAIGQKRKKKIPKNIYIPLNSPKLFCTKVRIVDQVCITWINAASCLPFYHISVTPQPPPDPHTVRIRRQLWWTHYCVYRQGILINVLSCGTHVQASDTQTAFCCADVTAAEFSDLPAADTPVSLTDDLFLSFIIYVLLYIKIALAPLPPEVRFLSKHVCGAECEQLWCVYQCVSLWRRSTEGVEDGLNLGRRRRRRRENAPERTHV